MALFWITRLVMGPLADRPGPDDPRLEASIEAEALFLDTDTGNTSLSNGQRWTPAGSLPLGLTSDAHGNLTAVGAIQATDITASGPGGTTPTITAVQASGQTGPLYTGINSADATVFSVGVDGEIVTSDDVLAPSGTVKGQTLAFAPLVGSGHPSTGAHNAGEMVMDSAGAIFVCTASGTPGTWKTVTLA